MAPEHDSISGQDPALDANEADVEEQHQPVIEEDVEDVAAAPTVREVPIEASEADVLDQSRSEPWDEDDQYG